MSNFVEQIHRIYDRHSPCIYPYIGSAFQEPSDGDLRIMGVGINARSEDKHWGTQEPGLYSEWFEKQSWRFQRGVWRDLKDVGERITKAPFLFGGRRFVGMGSVFLTNAVKVYVKDSEGRHADQLTDDDFKRHLDQWHDELDAMAEANLLPHVIAIVGRPFWGLACASFKESPLFKRFAVKEYRWCRDSSLHFANRISLRGPSGDHDLLLLRLRHPAGRAPTGSHDWLFDQADFKQIASA
jgi:hypothetical protein